MKWILDGKNGIFCNEIKTKIMVEFELEKLAEILPIFADAGSKIEIKPRLSAEEISLEKQ